MKNAPITAGYTFVAGDNITAELLNQAFELARAVLAVPFSIAEGGTGGITIASSQKNLGAMGRLEGWVEYTDDGTPVAIGTLPEDSFIHSITYHVTEAFDGGGTDLLELGWTADQDALGTSQDLASTGVLSPTMGANDGYNSATQAVTASYVDSAGDATAGKVLVVIAYFQVTTTP